MTKLSLACVLLSFVAACHHHNGNVLSDGGVGDLGDGGLVIHDGGIIVTLPDGGVGVCYVTTCQGHLYQCGDCTDNDGDGLVDSYDPDCLGPCQNNEAGFFGSIPGQNNAPCKSDCYWDQDTGSGNDACYWSHDCDPFEQGENGQPAMTDPELGCTYDQNANVPGAPVPGGQMACTYLASNQTSQCQSYCGPLTPNGCDCFGCCENPNSPGNFIYAGSVDGSGTPTCSSDPSVLADPTKCKPCTPVLESSGCYKPCGHCELCFGKTTLPDDCYQSLPDMAGTPPSDMAPPPPQQCPPSETACGLPGQPACPSGYYCITGCCAPVIL